MSELLYLHQTFSDCVSYQHWYVKMSDLTVSYGMRLGFLRFFAIFAQNYSSIHVWSALFSLNLHKLCIWCEYKHFVIRKCQMLPDFTAFFWEFSYIIGDYSSEVLYLRQTFTHILISEKKVLDRNWPYINTFQTILRNVCQSVVCRSSSSVSSL